MLNLFDDNKTKSIKNLIRILIKDKKNIILTLSSKGGVGKTTIAWGISKQYNIPYITNDYGSIFSSQKKKLHQNTYLAHYFKEDAFFKKAHAVVIDFKGEDIKNLSKEELLLVKIANRIIIPTGKDELLEHGGALKTTMDILKLNKKIMFIASDVPNRAMIDNMNSFIDSASRLFRIKTDSITICPLAHGGRIVTKAMRKDLNYANITDAEDYEKEAQKEFTNDWDKLQVYFKQVLNQKRTA